MSLYIRNARIILVMSTALVSTSSRSARSSCLEGGGGGMAGDACVSVYEIGECDRYDGDIDAGDVGTREGGGGGRG